MRAAAAVAVVILTMAVIRWIRSGDDFPLGRALPFMSGKSDPLYDFGSLAMVLIFIWGLVRMSRNHGDDT